jgi:phosphomannomutase
MSIFREYDIRGEVPSEIDEKTAYNIGLAAAKFLDSKTLIVGMDGRSSSLKLKNALIEGITDYGADVIDISLVSTPIFYHAVAEMRKRGIMVTASHNPRQYNGFKISDERAVPFVYETGIAKIEHLMGKVLKSSKKGKVHDKNIVDDYIRYIKKRFSGNFRNISVVADFSNGAGAVAEEIFNKLHIKNKIICDKIDGKFPCHGPNPLVKGSAAKLGREVRKQKADLGIIFDGDADRVFFADEKGNFVKTDYSFALLARDALRKTKGKCYVDLRFSRVVYEEIIRAGGEAVIMRVGNHFYKEALKKQGVIGAEYSDHIMYRENHSIDDGLYAALKMITLLARSGQKLSELVYPLMKYFDSDEIDFRVKDKDRVLQAIEKKYSEHIILKLDGVSVYAKDYWFNVRKSNTESVVRLKIEAKSKEILNGMIKRLKKEISAGH